jgi:hypothetical protein
MVCKEGGSHPGKEGNKQLELQELVGYWVETLVKGWWLFFLDKTRHFFHGWKGEVQKMPCIVHRGCMGNDWGLLKERDE